MDITIKVKDRSGKMYSQTFIGDMKEQHEGTVLPGLKFIERQVVKKEREVE
jgi:hypothetical protein